ncbi:MAG: squalene synthase HpnC [Pseudomonadota bacterium]|nr:squalene synthase HpnC [Pseudomonadota bacterium]
MSVDHYENFPVASLLCPPHLRPAVTAIYHFARTADDLADEGAATPAERLDALASYRLELNAALSGGAPGSRWPQVFKPLSHCIAEFALPGCWLHALLDAFEQDVSNPRYPDREALLGYCRLSANPVGRLLLHLYGIEDAQALSRSDAICSALQLINFWQDLSRDLPCDRVYVPLADLRAQQLDAQALRAGVDTAATRTLVRNLCSWATDLMHHGAPLALQIPGRAGWELRLVVQGGLRILEKIGGMDHATLSARPRIGMADAPTLLWRALRMPGRV